MRAFAGVLLAVSIFGLVFGAGPELALWFSSRTWQPGEATILKVEGAAKTKDSVTLVQYRYEARGGLHESTRVFLSKRWMPGGEVLAEWEKRFTLAQQQSRPMRLWISPTNPDDAVFIRELNWTAMSPLLVGAGLGMALGLAGLFWPARGRSETTETVAVAPSGPVLTVLSQAQPQLHLQAVTPPRVTHDHCSLAITRADKTLCAELQGKPGAIEVVESATLDRVDTQSILRWQDALPLNVLANKSFWHVRCALPREGLALRQAQMHPDDRWQVTFRLRCKGEVVKVSLPLPGQWWRQAGA